MQKTVPICFCCGIKSRKTRVRAQQIRNLSCPDRRPAAAVDHMTIRSVRQIDTNPPFFYGGTTVNRTYGTHKKYTRYIYITYFY